MSLLELGGAPGWSLHVLGSILLIGRVLHVWGMHMTQIINPARTTGIQMTLFVIMAGGVGAVLLYIIKVSAH